MADHCCSKKGETLAQLAEKADQRRILIIVMVINLVMFFAEFGGGLAARSSALMADSVDMLGDSFVYALSLYALKKGARWEAGAALTKGGIIFIFGIAVIAEIADKIVNVVPPSSSLMLGFGGMALAANLTCLALLWRFRKANVNMSSTFECSRNDVASNVGVLVAASLVGLTGSAWPDIAVGAIIAAIFLRSSWRVLSDAIPRLPSFCHRQNRDVAVTAGSNSSKAGAMFRWTYLLIMAVAASLTLASATHAGETPGGLDVECSGVVHTEGDDDQSPGEPDKGVQHHGHCHMATALLPYRAPVAGELAMKSGEPAFRDVTVLGRWIRGPSLRPPIA